MTVNLFTYIDLYDRALVTAEHLLNKGVEFAAAKGVGEAELLGWRLIDDMNPLAFQLMVVINYTRLWPARIAGLPEQTAIGDDLTVQGFRDAIAENKRYLATLTPTQFEGRDDVPVTYQIVEGMAPTLPAGQWLTVFATTNIDFHLTMTYAILRAHGVQIGKADMFARGL